MSFLEKISGILGGGLGQGITDIIKERVKDRDLAEKLEHEFRTLIETQGAALKTLAIEAERDADAQQQETIRSELAQSDEYTKRTRPMLARRSWWAVTGYVGVSLISAAVTAIPDVPIEWAVLTVLASPVLTYMGVRTFDKWKLGK